METKWLRCPKCGQSKMKEGYTMCYECNQKMKNPPKKVIVVKKQPQFLLPDETLRLENIELTKRIVALNDKVKLLETTVKDLTQQNSFLIKSNEAFKNKFLKSIDNV